ncbi:MAG: hypothetical protein JXN60_02535 [Lentisphaerae bacterium]|nr:hypothetical protein [Lentisphaerota bacterium]
MRNVVRIVSFLSVVCLMVSNSGCALLGTQTADGDADMKLGEYHGLKHAIGCKGFENESGWSGSWELGNNLTVMLESALFDTGRFVIVEREQLKDVIAEQDLIAGGRAAEARKVAKTGLIRPARYLATGAITQASEGVSGRDAGISVGGISLGGSKSKAQVTIVVKLVDTTTGEVVAKKSIVGKAGRTGLSVGLSYAGVGASLGGFEKTPMGEAAQDCINAAAVFLAKKMEEMPFEGSVVKTSFGKVYINRGTDVGLSAGKILVMRTEGELLTDPDTGAILGKEEGTQIGKLKITNAQEHMSICTVIEGEKSPARGTVVAEERQGVDGD